VGVAKEVMDLAGTSRRIRAVLVHARFFRMISITGNSDQLFPSSIVAMMESLPKQSKIHPFPSPYAADHSQNRCPSSRLPRTTGRTPR
jgi:hypothetical protein